MSEDRIIEMAETVNLWKAPTRKMLNKLGKMYGVKRRWFGLESNKSYRARIVEVISPGSNQK